MAQIDMSVWTGRDDTAGEGATASRWHQHVRPYNGQTNLGIVLSGFACDVGVARNNGRIGAAGGPGAIRTALANLAWHQSQQVYDAGNVTCESTDLETAQEQLAVRIATWVQAGQRPITLGGGHETAWGTMQGLFRARPNSIIGLVNIDAHFDLREAACPNSGTPFAQAAACCRPFRYFCLGIAEPANTKALFDRAKSLGVQWRLDVELHSDQLGPELDRIRNFVDGCDFVYLSLDLDVLPHSIMPAVSAPAARGVPLDIVERLAAEVVGSGKLLAVDVVEFNPRFDADGLAARTAAALVWRVARHWTNNTGTQS